MKKLKKILTALALVLVIAALVGFAYLYYGGYSGIDHHKSADEDQIKVACVGDSITYGHGITPWYKNNYPKLLGELLGDGYVVNNYGHHGATLQSTGDQPYISYKDYENSIEFEADILVFMLGSNDAKAENWIDESSFKAEYLTRLKEYREGNSDIRIILCTPPTSYRKNSENPARVEIIAKVVREIAEEENLQLLDVKELTEGREDLYLDDGVHLNNEGAILLAEWVYSAIAE